MAIRRRDQLSILLLASLVALVLATLWWLTQEPAPVRSGVEGAFSGVSANDWQGDHPEKAGVLRLGLIPERDIFEQRARYRALADYLAGQLGQPVELVTLNTYRGVLQDLEVEAVDAAFVGSMIAVLAHDRHGARIVVKPIDLAGVGTYRGVIFTRSDGPIQSVEDMAGRSLAMVRTTTAGNLYPIWLLASRGLLSGERGPRPRWVGTHDDVIREVMAGRIDAGAVKDLRLDAYEKAHPEASIRRLAVSDAVPNNALVLRAGVSAEREAELRRVLLAMDQSAQGRAALNELGALRFEPCTIAEFDAIFRMVRDLGERWDELGVEGPPPQSPPAASP